MAVPYPPFDGIYFWDGIIHTLFDFIIKTVKMEEFI